MMDLIRFEFYKIFKSKTVWSIMLLTFIGSLYLSTQMIGEDLKPSLKKIGGVITEQKVKEAQKEDQKILEKSADSGVLSVEDENMRDAYDKLFYVGHYVKLHPIKISDALNEAKETNSEYEKNKFELKADMLQNIHYDRLDYQRPMEQAVLYMLTGSLSLVLIYIILNVSLTYTNEYTSGVANYLLSSTNGRSKTLFAKLFAHWSVIALIILLSTFSAVLLWGVYDGFSGWNSPLQSIKKFYESPYPISIGQFIIVTALLQMLIGIALSTLILCISLISKSLLQSLALTLLIIVGPIAISTFIPLTFIPEKVLLAMNFIPSIGLNTAVLFRDFNTVNILGKPTLFPIVMILLMVLLLVLTLIFSFKLIKIKKI